MNETFTTRPFISAIFGVMALFFLVLGLRGLITRKPFLLSSRWMLGLILLAFTPQLLLPLSWSTPPGSGAGLSLLRWLPAGMFVLLGVFMWWTLRGYMAFGVTDTSLREGLLASLDQRQLPYEEKLGALHLPSVHADLQVAVQSWIGTGQLKMKQRKAAQVLTDVVPSVNAYFRDNAVSTKLGVCAFYLAFGVLIGAMAVLFAFIDLT